ncbi:RICIN domain-containing protein [Acrocarpospora catenulata]|uniref:RICIN domain-containing protein n=1 Tax=Acrocarpospora catenulata TaxID=2836182 RepID=UPI001BD961C0|nr:RICIN domain-containing protein [Acrocarpospora catenulata]
MRHIFVPAFAAVLAALTATATPASADTTIKPMTFVNQDLVNRMDGSRLLLVSDATADGTAVMTTRGITRDAFLSEAWDAEGTWSHRKRTWTMTLRNRAADKCLQPADDTPARGEAVVVRTCDGSDLQKWSLRLETKGGNTHRWWIWRPVTNLQLAMSVGSVGPDSNQITLDYAYPTYDRMWLLGPDNSNWW